MFYSDINIKYIEKKIIMDKFNIINGDCIKVMHIIGDNTVDLILC